MANLIVRTEDIKPEFILEMYAESSQDKNIVDAIKTISPVILEGSRGTGKSFLFRVAEAQLKNEYPQKRVLPVYVSFGKSSLLNSTDPSQFLHWMMARLCSRVMRSMNIFGALVPQSSSFQLLMGGQLSIDRVETPLEAVAKQYEESYKCPNVSIDSSLIPTVEDFKDAIEDVCTERGIDRICILFDEAAHVFRPEQQRQFFTLFRDLRSPYVSCNAAVYPGVTFYGTSFEVTHDANVITLNRKPTDSDYLSQMREIIEKQADSELMKAIAKHGENFRALAYSVSGNPRLLLKTIQLAPSMKSNEVKKVIKEFYRTDIWAEHSMLSSRYPGHKSIIEWGRTFLEETVVPEIVSKNDTYENQDKHYTTAFLWIHQAAPKVVFESLRMLCYTGILTQLDSGVVATRRGIGTRFAINIGCVVANYAEPIDAIGRIVTGLSLKRYTEYGENHPVYNGLTDSIGDFTEIDLAEILEKQLQKDIDVLELTNHQKNGLREICVHTIRDALEMRESDFQKIRYVGLKRSRKIMNVVVASVVEYLSG